MDPQAPAVAAAPAAPLNALDAVHQQACPGLRQGHSVGCFMHSFAMLAASNTWHIAGLSALPWQDK